MPLVAGLTCSKPLRDTDPGMPRRTLASTLFALALAGCATGARPTVSTAPAAPAAPAPARVSTAGIPLRVMTYNIRSGNGDLDATAAAIRAQEADVVGLQEVDVHWAERSKFADQAAELGAKLGMQVRFAFIYRIKSKERKRPPREFGVAVLSRYAVIGFRNETLTRLSTQDSTSTPTPMPGLLEVTLDVRGTPITVFDTHLDYRHDPSVRTTQVAEMLSFIEKVDGPVIVFGDMNATPDAPELQPLLRRLHDAWTGNADAGFTYPAESPTERIDYVLVSPQFRVRSARVPVTQASDHRPVVVDLVLDANASRRK